MNVGVCRECETRSFCKNPWDDPSVRWWATYHIRDWAPSYGPVQEVLHGAV